MYSQGNAWLQWIFLIDKKANFLLACNTKGSMPNHLQMESGVPGDTDGEEVEVAPRTARKRKARQVELENAMEEAKKIRESIGSVFDKVVVFLDQQNTQEKQSRRFLLQQRKKCLLGTISRKRKELLTK